MEAQAHMFYYKNKEAHELLPCFYGVFYTLRYKEQFTTLTRN